MKSPANRRYRSQGNGRKGYQQAQKQIGLIRALKIESTVNPRLVPELPEAGEKERYAGCIGAEGS